MRCAQKYTILTNLSEADEAAPAVRDALLKAYEQLKTTPLTELVPNFAEEWAKVTGGAPVSNAVIAHVFDISTEYTNDGKVTYYFDLDEHDVYPDTHVMLLHNYEGDKWEIVHCDHNEDEHITFTVDGLSPFGLIIDSEGKPIVGENAPTSPDTVETPVLFVSALSIVAIAALSSICFVKSLKRTVK